MVKIRLVCVGQLKGKFWQAAFNEYKKRLGAFCSFELIEVDEHKIKNDPSSAEIAQCLEREGEKILSKIPGKSYVIALCIEGDGLSSPRFAKHLENIFTNQTGEISLIIGSSFGLAQSVKDRADFLLSMSSMTFPHQLARVMLCEQIYRAFGIIGGSKYHK